MEYTFIERAPNHKGSNWFGHLIKLYVPNGEARNELQAYLTEHYGSKGRSWRLTLPDRWSMFRKSLTTIRFANKSDAMRFKLSWTEAEFDDFWNHLKVHMPTPGIKNSMWNIQTYNSMYPTWVMPTGYSNKTLLTQLKGRGMTNPCNEIMVDWEVGYADYLFGKCDSWTSYKMQLDAEVRAEDRPVATISSSAASPLDQFRDVESLD